MFEIWKPQHGQLMAVGAAAFPGLLVQALDTERMEEADLQHIDQPGIQLVGVDWKTCRASVCRFFQGSFYKGYLQNVIFDRCDLSGCDFRECVLSRVHFQQCKCTGANFADSGLNDVLFDNCILDHSVFTATRAKKLLFQQCRMSEAQMDELTGKDYRYDDCVLTKVNFHRTALKGLDLRSNDIDGILASATELRGATVTPVQASSLARLLGVIIA